MAKRIGQKDIQWSTNRRTDNTMAKRIGQKDIQWSTNRRTDNHLTDLMMSTGPPAKDQ
jgi:hypothetical protein